MFPSSASAANAAVLSIAASANANQDAAAAKAEMGQHYPLGRIAKPHEIGEVIVFLLSNKASFVTGAAWTIDGGLTSW